MATSGGPQRSSYIRPLLAALAVGGLLYVLLNLTPDKQWALMAAIAVFVVTFIVPVAQSEISRQMNYRDKVRFDREEAEHR